MIGTRTSNPPGENSPLFDTSFIFLYTARVKENGLIQRQAPPTDRIVRNIQGLTTNEIEGISLSNNRTWTNNLSSPTSVSILVTLIIIHQECCFLWIHCKNSKYSKFIILNGIGSLIAGNSLNWVSLLFFLWVRKWKACTMNHKTPEHPNKYMGADFQCLTTSKCITDLLPMNYQICHNI